MSGRPKESKPAGKGIFATIEEKHVWGNANERRSDSASRSGS